MLSCFVDRRISRFLFAFGNGDGQIDLLTANAAEIIPEALTLLVPPQYYAREQSLTNVPACA